MSPYFISSLERIENQLFDLAYKKLGLKPIGKCTIQELQEELKKRELEL